MSSQAKPRKAYQLLLELSISQAPFLIEDLIAATGWAESTVKTYLSKQWRDVVELRTDGHLYVRPELQRFSEEEFLQLATQNRKIFTTYQRAKYGEIVIYEFLLPLTREDQLRRALDDLFFEDTVKRRLIEIGLAEVTQWIQRHDDETDENYLARVCSSISDLFGGYSISHVSGRYRAGPLRSRSQASMTLAAEQRYIIDETSASVRFIIPIRSTRITDSARIGEVNLAEAMYAPDVAAEIALVHALFFSLFVAAIVRTVQGEDEIWLVEETGRTRSLYTWQSVTGRE